MGKWTATNAEIILDTLQRRLDLIKKMQVLVNSSETDELHDLQPLFEQGLWIFGPEFESVDFRSNRGLAEVINNFLGGKTDANKLPNKRPDFIILPDSSVGLYSSDSYDDATGEVAGLRKVVILELKRGGFMLTQKEADQARDYAKELRRASRVQDTTEIVAYVLGSSLEPRLVRSTQADNTHIIPMVYDTVLRKAHQRTFNLLDRLSKAQPIVTDPDVEAALEHQIEFSFTSESFQPASQ